MVLEIVSPGDIDPDLVTEKEFGKHTFRIREREIIWTFESEMYANIFLKIGHMKRFKRIRKEEHG